MTLRNIPILLRLARLRRYESRGDAMAALEYATAIPADGPFGGFVRAYRSKLMAVTRHPDALEYVRSTRRFISEHEGIRYASYCACYCDYLESVLLGEGTEQAKQRVLSTAASPFIRNSLIVI